MMEGLFSVHSVLLTWQRRFRCGESSWKNVTSRNNGTELNEIIELRKLYSIMNEVTIKLISRMSDIQIVTYYSNCYLL